MSQDRNVKAIFVYKDTWNRLHDLTKKFPDIKKVHFVDKAIRIAISTELVKREMEEDYGRSTDAPEGRSQ
jgi:hypothetical protein